MEKNEIYTCTVDGYTAEGMGVARVEGMALFIPGAAAGDRLRVRIVKVLKNRAYGRIEQILEPSPARITPACPVCAKCGGCDFLHLTYEEELRLKGQRVEDALRRIGGLDVTVGPARASTREGYRNKAQFPVTRSGGRAAFGFYRSRSHDVVPCRRCMIQDDRINDLAAAVCRWMDESGVLPYDEETGRGLIRHIYVRTGRYGSHLCLVAGDDRLPHTEALIEEARTAAPDLMGIVLNVNRDKTNRILGDTCRTLWGKDRLQDDLLGLRFELSPLSFYQVNHTQAEALYTRALELADLRPHHLALDLYCGVGTITLLLARRCRQAIGNEIVPQAVENANENARRNGIINARFLLGDAGQVASALRDEGLRPDVIVCDPPRKGMDTATVEAVAQMNPERIVYISCDPASLARDAARLAGFGYALTHAEAFDMFPGTANVETVCLLSKLSDAKHHVEVELNLDEMDLTSAESKATYEEIKAYVQEHAGLNVSKLYIAQTKRKCGIIERENYNLPKNEESKQPQCPPEKEAAIKDALKHFGMI